MDLKNVFQNIDIDSLNSLQPFQLLEQLGISGMQAQAVMQGDTSSLEWNQPDIIDLDIVLKCNKQFVNVNLIRYFFKKSFKGEKLSEEEYKIYEPAWINWFNLMFNICDKNTFQLDKELKDKSLVIKYGERYFHMTTFNGINMINYLGDNLKF